MHYLDTSVLAAYYCPEALSHKAQQVVSQVGRPAISPLVELELHSVLALKVRARVLSTTVASQIASTFQIHLADERYHMVAVGPREYALARKWLMAFNSSLRTLDALHLAAAFANELTLLSSDRALVRCAKQFGVNHQLV